MTEFSIQSASCPPPIIRHAHGKALRAPSSLATIAERPTARSTVA
jgi:hypothetical protein